jgi:DnaK suppressor protein
MNSHLTHAQRHLLRNALVNDLRRLDQSLSDQLGGAPRAEHAHDVLAQDGDEIRQHGAARAMDFTLSDRQAQAMGAIAAALARADTDAYGDCADCGEPIPFARLRAEPWALRCVDCESRRETRLR